MTFRNICFTILLSLPGIFVCGTAGAQEQHPHYLQALSDLRTARWLLLQHIDGKDMTHNEKEALRQINETIREINAAKIDDGKGADEHAEVQTGKDGSVSLRQCIEFLRKAKDEIIREEDGRFANGLRGHTAASCDEIIKFVQRIK